MSTACCWFINSVIRVDALGRLGVGGIVQQNCAQDGFFGVDVRRQSGVEPQIGDGGHI
jgi:hypothetical protein